MFKANQRRKYYFVLVMVLLALFLAILSFYAHKNPIFLTDLKVSLALQSYSNSFLDTLFNAVSFIGFPPQVYYFSAFLFLVFAIKKYFKEMYLLIANVVLTGIFSTGLKWIVNKPRLEEQFLIVVHKGLEGGMYTFPAGHVVSFVTIFGSLAVIALKRGTGPISRIFAYFCIVMIVLVGPSRIYLGEHWLSDVVGGYLLGGIILGLTSYWYLFRISFKKG